MKVRVYDPIFIEGLKSLPRKPNDMKAWAHIEAMDVYKWDDREVEAVDKDKREWKQISKRSITAENAEELENQVEESWPETLAIQDQALPSVEMAGSKGKAGGGGKAKAKGKPKVKTEVTEADAEVAKLKKDLEALDRAMSMEIKGTLKLLATGQKASSQDEKAWLAPLLEKVRNSLAELNTSQAKVRDVIATTRDTDELQRVVNDQKKCLQMFRNGFKKDLQKLLS